MSRRTTETGPGLFRLTQVSDWKKLCEANGISVGDVDLDAKELKVSCIHPDHHDSDPSARINLKYGNYHCWSCGKAMLFDPIQVVSLITNKTHAEAISVFAETFGIRPSKKAVSLDNAVREEDTKLLSDIVEFGRYILKKSFRMHDNGARLDDAYTKGVEWLKSRGVKTEHLDVINVGQLPGLGEVDNLIQTWLFQNGRSISELASFKENYQNYYGVLFNQPQDKGLLLFPMYTSPTRVGAIQFRTDFLRTEEEKKALEKARAPRFKFVTAPELAPEHIKRLFQRENGSGFYGLDTLRGMPKDAIRGDILATEGVTDCIAVIVAQLEEFQAVSWPCIGVAGTGQKDGFDLLRTMGLTQVHFLQDAPEHNGDSVLQNYLRISSQVDIKAFKWPEDLAATRKDMSEILTKDGAKALIDVVMRDGAFEHPHTYVLNLLLEKADGTSPETTKRFFEEHLNMLGSKEARKALTVEAARQFENISEEEVQEQAVLNDDNSRLGFLLRLKQDIENHFEFLYREQDREDENKTVLVVRKKVASPDGRQRTFRIHTTGIAMEHLCVGYLPPLGEWAREARMPTDLRMKGKGGKGGKQVERGEAAIATEMRTCLAAVAALIARELPEYYDKYADRVNGVYQIEDTKDGQERVLVVNGDFRAVGVYDHTNETNPVISWQEYMPEFQRDCVQDPWTRYIDSVEALESGNNVDMRKLYQSLYKVIDTGWGFKDQKADTHWLTCLAIYSGVFDFSPRTLATIVTGERGSGKSMLSKKFFGGKQTIEGLMPEIPWYESVAFSTSNAGIQQTFSGASGQVRRGLSIDEFENTCQADQAKMDKLFDMVRDMFDGEATIIKGTPTGQRKNYTLKFPVIFSGILEYEDPTGAMESRLYRIQMEADPQRNGPEIDIPALGLDLDQISRDLALGVFRWGPTMVKRALAYQNRMIRDGFGSKTLHRRAEARTCVTLSVIAAVLSVCGFSDDGIEGICGLMFKKMARDEAATAERPGERIWSHLMSMTARPIDSDGFADIGSGGHRYDAEITLYDSLLCPDLRKLIGTPGYFNGTYVIEHEGYPYIILDKTYLLNKLKQAGVEQSWPAITKLLKRCFETLDHDVGRLIAGRQVNKRFRQKPETTVLYLRIPDDIVADMQPDDEGPAPGNNDPGPGGVHNLTAPEPPIGGPAPAPQGPAPSLPPMSVANKRAAEPVTCLGDLDFPPVQPDAIPPPKPPTLIEKTTPSETGDTSCPAPATLTSTSDAQANGPPAGNAECATGPESTGKEAPPPTFSSS